MDYGQVLYFAFSWRETRNFLKYVGLVWLIDLLFFLSLALISYFLFKNVLLNLFSGSYSAFEAIMLNSQLVGGMAITLFFSAIPLFLLFALLLFFAQALIILFGLRQGSLNAIKPDLTHFFSLFFLAILTPFAALLCWFNKKKLLLPLFAILFAIAAFIPNSAVGSGSGALSAVLFLAYLIVAVYNFLRLSLAIPIFLSEGGGLFKALEESWRLTRKRVWSLIIAFAFVALVVAIASLMFVIVLSLLLSSQLFRYLSPTSFLLALCGAILFSLLLLQPFQLLSFNFAAVAIYNELLPGEKEGKPSRCQEK